MDCEHQEALGWGFGWSLDLNVAKEEQREATEDSELDEHQKQKDDEMHAQSRLQLAGVLIRVFLQGNEVRGQKKQCIAAGYKSM